MATTPFLMILSRRFNQPKMDKARDDLDGPEKSGPSTAIVVGYGRFGQTVAQMLMAAGQEVTIIDSKPEQIEIAERFDLKVYYGDGTRLELLRQAGGEEVRTIVFAMDGDQLSPEELTAALAAFRQAAIFVRAFDRRALIRYKGIDVSATVREVFESAIKMGRLALTAVGTPDEEVDKIERAYRLRDHARLKAQVEEGSIYATAGKELMFRNGKPLGAEIE